MKCSKFSIQIEMFSHSRNMQQTGQIRKLFEFKRKKIKCTIQCYHYILRNNERINIIFISNVIFLTNSSCACCSTGEMRISTNQLIESIFLIFRRRYNVDFTLNTCRTYKMKKTKSRKKESTHSHI